MKLLFKLLMRIGLISSGPAVTGITSATQIEGTSLVHTVTLASAVAVVDGLYPFSLSGVTATSGTDYTATPTFSAGVTRSGGTLTVPVGVSSFTITVSTTNDAVFEGTETYSITVGGMTNTGTITDDESAPTIASVSSASATEGSNIVHTVAVTGTAQASRTFAFAFSGAAVGGTDYNATPTFSAGVTLSGGNITVPAGVTSFTVTVATINNASVDGSRAYTLTIGGASGTGSISDDDAPSPAFTVTMTALSNASGTVTTNAYINGGGGGGGTPSDLLDLLATLIAGGSVTGTGGITTATTGIASRSSGTAPCYVHFDATATTNSLGIDNFHDILYIHNFGDGSAGAWTYGTTASTGSKNVARGAVAAHVYETAGTYTHRVTPVTVSSSGTLSYGTTTSTSITVAAADTTYTGTATIAIGSGTLPVAGVNGVPAGAQCFNETTLSGAYSHITADNQRIMFKRGDTWTANGTVTCSYKGIQHCAFGTGAKPKFTVSRAAGDTYGVSLSPATGPVNFTMMDAFWDGVASVGDGVSDGKKLLSVTSASLIDSNTLMLRVDSQYMGQMLTAGYQRYIAVVDCNGYDFCGDHGNVGIWSELGESIAVLGTRIDNCWQIEHNIRTQGCPKSVYSNNTLSQAGIQSENGGLGLTKHIVALRGSTLAGSYVWTGIWTEFCLISDNVFDGGTHGTGLACQVAPQSNAHDERIRDVIVERNLFTGQIAQCITSEALRCTSRNNLANGNIQGLVEVLFQTVTTSPLPDDNKVYNNSIYSTSTGQFSAVRVYKTYASTGSTNMTGTLSRNNLAYAPSATADTFGNSPAKFIVKAGLVTPTTTEDHNSSNAQVIGTVPGFTIPPTSTLTTFKPTSGYGIDGGDYAPVFEDFFGAARVPTYDIGAVNP